jgi:5'-nucleotidase
VARCSGDNNGLRRIIAHGMFAPHPRIAGYLSLFTYPIETCAEVIKYSIHKGAIMNDVQRNQILLTNDDGIQSPGLWSAAESLSSVGFVHVAAPSEQFSGAGRSLPYTSSGIISSIQMGVNGKPWTVFGIGGTPAQAVLHAVLEILPQKPNLVVSGINYGENLGSGVTISGTVGAALEAASLGIPAIAVSLETDPQHHLSYSTEIDFSTAAHFTVRFASLLLARQMPEDVQVLKIDIPAHATLETPWMITRLSRQRYYEPLAPQRKSWETPGPIRYRLAGDPHDDPVDTDVYALRVRRLVSVTPLSLDMTSRVDLKELERMMRET